MHSINTTPFWQSNPITSRLDGTFEIAHENGDPYQVCPLDIDPVGAYDFDEIFAFWNALPDDDPRKLTQPEPSPVIVTMAEAQAAKLADVINGSNKAALYLKSLFSEAEANSWPQQEAGARAILGVEAEVKDDTAASILKDTTRLGVAVDLVHQLAAIDGVTPAAFAARIVANADAAYGAKILTLTEQRALERLLKDAVTSGDVSAVQALGVMYSLPPKEDAS